MPPMSDQVSTDQLKDQLSRLPTKARAELAHFLIESLDGQPDDDWEAAWDSELARRIESVENGTAVPIAGEEVLARWRAKYP